MRDDAPARRRVLAAVAGIVAGATAGCAGGAGSGGDDRTTAGAVTDAAVTTGATSADGADLDLREANVVDVAVERDGDAYDFAVTLHHDDDGEEGYANWWQVERLDGGQLGRRDLLHAHSRQPFTRSETIEIPEGVDCVVVRGHDQTHGYGGRLAVVAPDSGAIRTVDQGPEPQSTDGEACPGG
ncbi:hypothetical protein [Halobellus ruber]|uniref:Uncharacterized protein n=1 Tax=Halobellus ruber TaxID=2761102 RepID=A0A7J9SL06_9EURY|nr:hypothetical protein [Halobellus ruber]MBB6647378.1 hypothetical protein [Halobellus ruber]